MKREEEREREKEKERERKKEGDRERERLRAPTIFRSISWFALPSIHASQQLTSL